MKIIDADALKEVIKANHYLLSARNNSVDYGMFTTGIMQAIDNAPTVDIEEQIAGAYNEGYMCGSREAELAYAREIKRQEGLNNIKFIKQDKGDLQC